MSNLVEHAKIELAAAKVGEDLYGEMLPNAVLELIEVFAKQGHSGMSAGIVISIFKTLASFEPLSPLTGADDEWVEVNDGLYQNRRCSHVFRENGAAYDISGRVFREPSGSCYTSRDSRVSVTFPYTPKREYVDAPAR